MLPPAAYLTPAEEDASVLSSLVPAGEGEGKSLALPVPVTFLVNDLPGLLA